MLFPGDTDKYCSSDTRIFHVVWYHRSSVTVITVVELFFFNTEVRATLRFTPFLVLLETAFSAPPELR